LKKSSHPVLSELSADEIDRDGATGFWQGRAG
jgi:hypothetical protein